MHAWKQWYNLGLLAIPIFIFSEAPQILIFEPGKKQTKKIFSVVHVPACHKQWMPATPREQACGFRPDFNSCTPIWNVNQSIAKQKSFCSGVCSIKREKEWNVSKRTPPTPGSWNYLEFWLECNRTHASGNIFFVFFWFKNGSFGGF